MKGVRMGFRSYFNVRAVVSGGLGSVCLYSKDSLSVFI